MKKISIVSPAYNEEGNIPILAKAIKEIFQTLPYDYELILLMMGVLTIP